MAGRLYRWQPQVPPPFLRLIRTRNAGIRTRNGLAITHLGRGAAGYGSAHARADEVARMGQGRASPLDRVRTRSPPLRAMQAACCPGCIALHVACRATHPLSSCGARRAYASVVLRRSALSGGASHPQLDITKYEDVLKYVENPEIASGVGKHYRSTHGPCAVQCLCACMDKGTNNADKGTNNAG